MYKPDISIGIPAYKTNEILLREAINCILAQTFNNFELIIVNDGADENTKKTIQSYNDQRIKYFETEMALGGPAKARNIILNNAQGKYIFFHDHDDYIASLKALENCFNEAEKNDLDILMFEIIYTENKNNENHLLGYTNLHKILSENIFNYDDEKLMSIFFSAQLNAVWNKFFRMQLFKENNLYFSEDLKLSDDIEIFFRYIFHAKKIKMSNQKFYCHRKSLASLLSREYLGLGDAKLFEKIRASLKVFKVYDKLRLSFFEGQIQYFEMFLNRIKTEDYDNYKKLLKETIEHEKITENDFSKLSQSTLNFLSTQYKFI